MWTYTNGRFEWCIIIIIVAYIQGFARRSRRYATFVIYAAFIQKFIEISKWSVYWSLYYHVSGKGRVIK